MDRTAGPAGQLGWYARRLRSMSPAEVGWRGRRWVGHRVPRQRPSSRRPPRLQPGRGDDWDAVLERFRTAQDRPVLLDRARARTIAEEHPDLVTELLAAAEGVRSGRRAYFGYPEAQLASPVDWNHDVLRDVWWPLRDSTRIDHRTAAADPKWIWELNRLQHLPLLAEAWLFTGDDGYAELALDHLDSWIDQNPVGQGIAWRGAFEAGIRAISVALALQGLRDSPALTSARLRRSASMLAASADLCWRDRSRFSSANNHLVGELAGLATVAMLFPELAAAPRWERRALTALADEATRQILPDGAGAEQAVGYQIFTAELLLVVSALLTSRGDAAPPAIAAAVERSADYLAAVVGDLDPDLHHGDDDEGFAVRLGPEPLRTIRDHLGLVGAFSGHPGAQRAGRPTLSAAWLASVARPRPRPGAPAAQNLFAPHGGLVVLRAGPRRLTMDVGPLGYLSIAAHGHADALALTVSIGGREVVGDPGAGSYYGHPAWRAVHRGTRAHATVTVDGLDQSVAGGPFLWNEHARAQVRAVDLDRGLVDAEHDGYRRLPAPVDHRRWLLAPPTGEGSILVLDEVAGTGEHEVRVSWPVHPDLEAEQLDHGFRLTCDGEPVVSIVLAATGSLDLERVRGDPASQLGWWSHRLEAREPSWLLAGVTHGTVPLVVATVVRPAGRGADPSELTVSQEGDRITVSWSSGGQRHTVLADRARSGSLDLQSLPLPDPEPPRLRDDGDAGSGERGGPG